MELNINSRKVGRSNSVTPSTSENNADQLTQRKFDTNYLSSVQRYENEWHDLSVIAEDPTLKHLRRVAADGHLKVSKFRSICWALLLDVINGESVAWVKQRRKDREWYQDVKKKTSLNPHSTSDIEDDPLSQSKQSVWNQHFCNKELCAVIKQDVVRTFPGVDFFRKPMIQEIMINILFCYARENSQICYRQGMHEILAPILFVMHSDHQALLHIQDMTTPFPELAEVLNPQYLEEDAYFIFSKIMKAIESYYRIHDLVPSATGYFPVSPTTPPDEKNKSKLEVVGQLNFIRDRILAKEDLHLHNHLLKLDIPLPIFGIRWLRLLFGREFPLQDLLILWDAIFSEGNNFELTNFIVVAMLIRIRSKLLIADYTTCLTYLMKYPSNTDISLIIRHAMHLKSPQKYERPPGAFVYISAPNQKPELPKPQHIRATTLPRNVHSKVANIEKDGRKHTHSHDETQMKLATKAKQASEDKLQLKINGIQTTTTLETMKIAANSQSSTDQASGIVDGYLEDSPEVLKLQFRNAQAVMSISRLKLTQYLAVLRKHNPGNSVHEVHQALDGIEELCALLNTNFRSPYTVAAPVEPAFEVNEADQNKHTAKYPIKVPTTLSLQQKPKKRYISEQEAKKEFVRHLCNEDHFEIAATEEEILDIQPNSLATYTMSNSDIEQNTARKCRYEIPDNEISRTAAKILGDRKEVEMHEFSAKNIDLDDFDYVLVPNIDPSGERDSSNE